MRRPSRRTGLALAALLAACAAGPGPAAPPPAATTLPAARAPARPNAEMARDILDLAFRLESGRELPRLSRFDGPVAVRILGPAPPTLRADLEALLNRLGTEAGLDVALAAGPDAAITVQAVPSAAIARAIPGAACAVVPRAASWDGFLRLRGSAALDWSGLARRDRALIVVPADAPPQELRDCLHEELAQALGPLGDLYGLPDSVFNDDNIHGVLTGFDMLALRALNDPALAAGPTREEAATRLPAILARLNPAGEGPTAEAGAEAPRDWTRAVAGALSPAAPPAHARAAAAEAVAIGRARGLDSPRAGLALYAQGRALAASDPDAARAAFRAARDSYGRSPLTAIHAAHVDLQLAAFALARGGDAEVLALTERAIPVARAYENPALQATLMMLRAEALDALGRRDEAERLRLDSLPPARYGFGDAGARDRLAAVQALRPSHPSEAP